MRKGVVELLYGRSNIFPPVKHASIAVFASIFTIVFIVAPAMV